MTSRRWVVAAVVVLVALAVALAVVLVRPPDERTPSAVATSAPATSATPSPATSVPPPPTGPPAALTAALVAGSRAAPVPDGLTPAPSAALDSVPVVWTNGCQASPPTIDQPACVYGDTTAPRTVVLFGDSHAGQLFPAFDAAAKAGGWRLVVWTKSSCPVMDLPVYSRTFDRTYTECETWRERTVARIVALRPDLVVASQTETIRGDDRISASRFARATLRTLLRIQRGTGAPVRYVQDTPLPGFDVPGCITDNPGDASACSYRSADGYASPQRHAAIAPVLRPRGITVTPVKEWFCADGTCPAVVGSTLVYRDDSHLTEPYARMLRPLAEQVLRGGR